MLYASHAHFVRRFRCSFPTSQRTATLQKRYIPISALVILTAFVAIIGYLVPQPAQSVPERILLDNAGGKVVFDHAAHFNGQKISCQTCHHESTERRDSIQRCGICHGVAFNEVFRKTHAETIKDLPSCATCHHMEFAPKAKWDHTAHAQDYAIDCRDCHHKDTSIEPEPQSCADCHQKTGDASMPSLRKAVHEKCQSCHGTMFEEKVKGCVNCHTTVESRPALAKGTFKVSPDYADCAVCHVDQKTKDLIPGRMAAFHGQCIKCHEKNDKGPFRKDHCNQCHTK